MGWVGTRLERACGACGRLVPAGAGWCGGCGASMMAPDPPAAAADADLELVIVLDDHPRAADPVDAVVPEQGRAGRRLWALLLVLLLGLGVGVTATRDEPGEAVLGALDGRRGTSSTGPPPEGLRIAWAHRFEAASDTGWSEPYGLTEVVTAGPLIRVNDVVLDRTDGRVVALQTWSGGRRAAEVVDGDVVLVDTLTGEVVRRTPLAEELLDLPHGWPALHQHGTTVLRTFEPVDGFGPDREGSLLVAADGSLVRSIEATLNPWWDHVAPDALAVPLRGPTGPGRSGRERIEVVDLATGETVLELDGSQTTVADAAGDLVATMATGAEGFDLPRSGEWSVTVWAASDGSAVAEGLVASDEPPRLLGRLGEQVLVTAVDDGAVQVWDVAQPGVQLVAAVEARRTTFGDPDVHASVALSAAAVADGHLLLADAGTGRVLALTATGDFAWERSVPGVVRLGAGGDVVAAISEQQEGQLLLDVADGSVIARVVRVDDILGHHEPPMAPVVSVAGTVGFSRGHGAQWEMSEFPLAASTWLDVERGRPVDVDEVLTESAAGGGSRTESIHGTRVAADGSRRLVVTDRGRGELRVVDGGGGGDIALVAGPSRSLEHGWVVGGDAEHLVVAVEEFLAGSEHQSTGSAYIADLATGATTVVPDLHVLAVGHGLLLGVPADPGWGGGVPPVVAHDLATGAPRWEMAEWGYGRFVVDEEDVLVPDTFVLSAYAADTGTRRWEQQRDRLAVDGPVVTGQHLVEREVGTTVVARRRDDGTIAWRADLGTVALSHTGAGDHVVVGTLDGLVLHLDDRGREVQRIAVSPHPVTSVAVLGDTVVAVAGGQAIGLRTDGDGITRQDQVDVP